LRMSPIERISAYSIHGHYTWCATRYPLLIPVSRNVVPGFCSHSRFQVIDVRVTPGRDVSRLIASDPVWELKAAVVSGRSGREIATEANDRGSE
jgi:hypothetical protein